MVRVILAMIGGFAAAIAIVFAADALFHAVTAGAPVPSSSDKAAMAAYVAGQPAWLLAAMVASWTLAAFVGAWLAARYGRRGAWPGWIVAALFLAATTANFAMVEHPVWMVAASVAAIVAAGWAAARLGERQRLQPAA